MQKKRKNDLAVYRRVDGGDKLLYEHKTRWVHLVQVLHLTVGHQVAPGAHQITKIPVATL